MANVSNANGSFYISKSAWEGMRPLFTEYNRQYNTPCYGVYSWDVFDGEEEVTIEFAANGRWSLASTMEDPYAIFGAYDNPLGKEIIEYIKTLGTEGLRYEYADEDTGMEFLYRATGYSYVNESGDLIFLDTLVDEYVFTAKNRYELGLISEYYESENDIVSEIEKTIGQSLSKEQLEFVRKEISGRKGFADYEVENLAFDCL